MRKHVKSYGEYLNEALTSGQVRAASSGKNLLNIGQAAVAFVLALESIADRERGTQVARKITDKYGSINGLMRDLFGTRWQNMDFRKWIESVLKDTISIAKVGSLYYAVEKMKKMLAGDFSKDGSQTIYDVIERYFKQIDAMSREELVQFIDDYVKDPAAARYQPGYEEEPEMATVPIQNTRNAA